VRPTSKEGVEKIKQRRGEKDREGKDGKKEGEERGGDNGMCSVCSGRRLSSATS